MATFPDHFFLPLAPLLAAAVVAEVTARLKVGTLLLAAGFRHPAVLAKELATLDVLTDGRLEVGSAQVGWRMSTSWPDCLSHTTRATRSITRGHRDSEESVVVTPSHPRRSLLPPPWRPLLTAAGSAGRPPASHRRRNATIFSASARVADIVTIAPGAIGVLGGQTILRFPC